MKKNLQDFAFLLFFLFVSVQAGAQCKTFARNVCKVELAPFIHDGNYDAAILSEGEEADLFKTFQCTQQYRLIICADHIFSKVEFKVIDANRNVLFNNLEHNLTNKWDFKLGSSQQLKIVVKVPLQDAKKSENDILSGCVAILIGFRDKGE